MSTLANIPVNVRPDVEEFVDEIGERKTYERMLRQIPVHFAGVRSIDILLELPHDDFSRGPHIMFVVGREDPGDFYEPDRRWEEWVNQAFSSTESACFGLCSYRV
jgi:hypothetical protein